MQNSSYLRFLGWLSSLLLASFLLLSPASAQEVPQEGVQEEYGPPENPPEVVPAEQSTPPVEQASVQAAPVSESIPTEPGTEWNSTVFPLMKVGGGVGIVLGLILGGFWAMRRIAPQYFAKRASGKMLRLVETLSMGDKRAIAIIDVAGKSYLIGNTPGQITLLAALQNPPSVSAAEETMSGVGTQQGQKPQNGSFLDLYQAAKSTPLKAARPAEIPPDIRSKMRELRQALEQ